MTIPQTFELALQHHQAGRLAEAEALYRQILAVQPNHADALHHLGVLAHQAGRQDLATQWIRQAVSLNPNDADAHCNLGEVYRRRSHMEEAIASYRRAVELNPGHALAYYNLGCALCDLERLDEGIAAYQSALQCRPNYVEAHNNLGAALAKRGHLDKAVAAYCRALELCPNLAETYNNLGNALKGLDRVDEATAAFRKALEIQPANSEVYSNLGNTLRQRGQLDEAIAACRSALRLKPGNAKAHLNLGNALKDAGLLKEAIAAFRRALQLQPDHAGVQSNIILTLYFLSSRNDRAIVEEKQGWNRLVSERTKALVPAHSNDRNPERRLRIGYISPDFRDHVVGRNVLPVFKYHDHQQFEVICLSDITRPDRLTEEFCRRADHWRSTAGLSDEALTKVIQNDGIDILLDLSQHTAGNRLPLFARRPAPVQVSFAGYPASSGVEAIEYRISDRYLEAGASEIGDGSSECGVRNAECGTPTQECMAGSASQIGDSGPVIPHSAFQTPHSERVFLIDSFWCYDPCGMEVAVNGLPAKAGGRITFGSLTNFCKINDFVLKLWARVLAAAPDSLLVLLSGFGSHRERTLEFLAREGVATERVEFVAPRPRREYLELYHGVDIALDPFPYGGHTTSLDALWMGVPVVSLAGERTVSRAGLSILNNLGLPELVAFSEEGYVAIAADLAGDLSRLAELRRTLRPRMEASVLMDAPRFARGIEAAYRAMWRQWCAEQRA